MPAGMALDVTDQPKNPAAVALGRLGGKKGGLAKVPKGFAKATPEQRAAWGRKGGKAKKQSVSVQKNPDPLMKIKSVMSADDKR